MNRVPREMAHTVMYEQRPSLCNNAIAELMEATTSVLALWPAVGILTG